MIKITKRSTCLSDGSVVHDVTLSESHNGVVAGYLELNANGGRDADHLVEALRAALVSYTVNEPHIHEMDVV